MDISCHFQEVTEELWEAAKTSGGDDDGGGDGM